MALSGMSIGVVARQTGCTVPTIRYYEEIGLLPTAARSDSGQRSYDQATLRRVAFVRRCRDFGFSIEQVRELVGIVDQPDRPCVDVREIASLHLTQVRRKLDELRELEASLSAFVCSCDAACAGGPSVDCTILEDLSLPAGESSAKASTSCCSG